MQKLIVLLAVAIGLVSSPAVAAPIHHPDVVFLMRQATALVTAQPQFARAVLVQADGQSPNGRARTTARGMNQWGFFFNNKATPRKQFSAVYIGFAQGRFSQPIGYQANFKYLRNLRPLPTMTFRRCVRLFRAAGFKQPIFGVTLYYPVGTSYTEPAYFVALRKDRALYVEVGTKSGKVTQLGSVKIKTQPLP